MACGAFLAMSVTSCYKTCYCKSYVLGIVVVGSSHEQDVKFGQTCASYSEYDEANETGVKCE